MSVISELSLSFNSVSYIHCGAYFRKSARHIFLFSPLFSVLSRMFTSFKYDVPVPRSVQCAFDIVVYDVHDDHVYPHGGRNFPVFRKRHLGIQNIALHNILGISGKKKKSSHECSSAGTIPNFRDV